MANAQLTHAHENCVKLCKTLRELCSTGEFTDVTIRCDDETFRCHRAVLAAASSFFRTIFNSPAASEEARTGNVTIGNISAQTFRTISDFIYTGDVLVNTSNVIDLLEAGEYLQMGEGIEKLCVEFIEKYKISVEKTLEMFVLACRTRKERLIDILSRDIAEHMRIFSANDLFLEISHSDLVRVVERWSSLPAKSDEWLYGALVRWVFHKRAERFQFFEDLRKVIKLKNLRSEYGKFIVKELDAYEKQPSPDPIALVESIKPFVSYDFDQLLSRDALQNPTKILKVFVQYGTQKELMKACVMNVVADEYTYSDCSLANSINDTIQWLWIRNVAINDGLTVYCLQCHTFASTKCTNQSFRSCVVNDSHHKSNLKPPPLIFQDVCVCPLETNIYLYDRRTQPLSSGLTRLQSTTLDPFNDEELNRGMYVYSCELDKWFPGPAMKRKLQDSCMTECDRTLYLIGGDGPKAGGNYSGYAQAYDYRVGKWRRLPKTVGNYVAADCCSINDSIYVCGGMNNARKNFERYDPKAGKWESLCPASKQMHHHQAISYCGALLAVGGYSDNNSTLSNLSMEIYDPSRNTWDNFDLETEFDLSSHDIILDSVVMNIYD